MAAIKIADSRGKTINLVKIDGRLYTNFPIDHIKNGLNLKAKPDDILLCTYPKSGTHWTWEIIRCLLAGKADLPSVDKIVSMIEVAPPADLDAQETPRNLNTHFHFEKISPDILNKKCKIIYVTRDPRDVAVSLYIHSKRLTEYYDYDGDWVDYLPMFLEGQVDYDSWFEYTKGWEKAIKDNPDHPILVLSYEDMKLDSVKEIKRIADFIGVSYTESFIEDVARESSFDSMRKKHQERAQEQNPVMYRKGQVGDWKNTFTVAQSEMFEEKFEKEMQGTNAHQLYSRNV